MQNAVTRERKLSYARQVAGGSANKSTSRLLSFLRRAVPYIRRSRDLLRPFQSLRRRKFEKFLHFRFSIFLAGVIRCIPREDTRKLRSSTQLVVVIETQARYGTLYRWDIDRCTYRSFRAFYSDIVMQMIRYVYTCAQFYRHIVGPMHNAAR